MKAILSILGAVLIVFGSYSSTLATTITSSFDLNDEGWTITGLGNSIYESSGGNPGGYLRLVDTGGDSYGVLAPSKFYGDLSLLDGGMLSYDVFDIRSYQLTTIGSGFGRIQIIGGGLNATFDYAPNPPIPSNQDWTTYYVPMTASSWNISQENWETILSNVTSISIVFNLENMGFDNFEITSVPDASVMLLLGSSLMGLAVFSRKSKRS